ncbi:MAG: hypothetical protein D6791_10120 [Chloroflexi bacterium]|nr:MAG: hypothetical protein D6791_10120 [Chloroflexota bacterium]
MRLDWKRLLLFLYKLGLVSLVVPAGYWILQSGAMLADGEIWQWSFATILAYLLVALYFEVRPGAVWHVAISVLVGYLLTLVTPDPAGDFLFGMVYGPMLAVAAYWDHIRDPWRKFWE